mgnify:FL=1
MSEKVELQVNKLFNANIESKESQVSKCIDIFKPEPKEYDVLNDNWPKPKPKVKKKKYNNKNFFCLRCRQRFNRTENFKRHIDRPVPGRVCAEVPVIIHWGLVKENAHEQIDYYKKNKKFMYKENRITEAHIQLAKDKSSTFLRNILRYTTIESAMNKKSLIEYFKKKERLGYEKLFVEYHDPTNYLTEELIYLTKNGIIYAPYNNNNNGLIKVGFVKRIHYADHMFRIHKQKNIDAYMKTYDLDDNPSQDEIMKANQLNSLKINPFYQIAYNKDENGWEIDIPNKDFNRPSLDLVEYWIKEDSTTLDHTKKNKSNKSNKPYGYTTSYYSATYKECTGNFKINDKPVNQKYLKFNKKKLANVSPGDMAMLFIKRGIEQKTEEKRASKLENEKQKILNGLKKDREDEAKLKLTIMNQI